jgi:hypothetical protein
MIKPNDYEAAGQYVIGLHYLTSGFVQRVGIPSGKKLEDLLNDVRRAEFGMKKNKVKES